ncbi:MAG TPA: hypothetical protein VHJ99_14760 [Candidatus Dormibacteraeota bacterium]|nr:hypothetical protein [Candidatus Dormibacteraeota bacterium]
MKAIGILAISALLTAACSIAGSGSTPSAVSVASASPSANPADSKAADLRTRLDLLLAEHVMLVAKQAVAASNHTDEYAGYLALLTANGNSLVDVMHIAYGNTAASQFDHAWGIQNGYQIDYTIGMVTHNDNKANGAMSGLVNGFVPQFAQLMTSLTQIPLDQITQLETRQLTDAKAVIDDEVAQSYTKLYADLRSAYANSRLIGDRLAIRIAEQFADKFPGDPSIGAVDARVSLNDLLQEHSYVTTLMSDAGIAGRGAEAAAALSGVAGVRADLGPVMSSLMGPAVRTSFDQLWGVRDADLFGYANSSDAGARQRLTGSFVSQFSALTSVAAPTVRDQVIAALKVMDEQRAKAYKDVAGDDRAAAAAMQAIADRIG